MSGIILRSQFDNDIKWVVEFRSFGYGKSANDANSRRARFALAQSNLPILRCILWVDETVQWIPLSRLRQVECETAMIRITVGRVLKTLRAARRSVHCRVTSPPEL